MLQFSNFYLIILIKVIHYSHKSINYAKKNMNYLLLYCNIRDDCT